MRLTILVVLAVACTHPSPPAASVAPPAAPVATAPAVPTPDPVPGPAAMPALAPSATHRVLEWLVDAIAHRKGDVSRDELAQYCEPSFLGPVAGTAKSFHTWSQDADGAVLQSIEVDDPTYVRAYLATRDHHWRITLEIDEGTSKLSYLRFESMP